MTWRSDRRKYPPYGLADGHPGRGSRSVLNPDKQAELLPTKINTRLRKGDIFLHQNAGGGGYGSPMDREQERVWWDWRNGKVTTRHAKEVYGVVIDEQTGQINEIETDKLRSNPN